jgi:signal peptide peptidase SppA
MTPEINSQMSGFLHGFNRGALLAPVDALGLSNLPLISSHLLTHLTATEEAREAAMDATMRAVMAHYGQNPSGMAKPFPFTRNGTAIIPVHGVLLNRFNYITSYASGYNAIRSLLNSALADDEVRQIVFDINSPGGMAAGAFELAADIRAGRGKKPISAVVDAYAFSAAYAIASATDKIVVSPSGEVGSIGVVTMHANLGPALKEIGIEVTFIYAGKHKVDGNPYEALTPEVREAIQASVDRYYSMFVSAVGEGRGSRLDADGARATEARCYMAEEAVQAGLADSVMAPDAALVYFEGDTTSNPSGALAVAETAEKEPAQMTEQNPAASSAADARAEERARVAAILSCEEAKGRGDLASHLATNTDMTVEQARAALAAAPQATAPAERNVLADAMRNTEQPNVGADGDGSEAGETKMSVADRIWSNYSAATGVKSDKPRLN